MELHPVLAAELFAYRATLTAGEAARLDKALAYLAAGRAALCPARLGDVLVSGSAPEPYRVGPGSCDCAWGVFAGERGPCSHRMARRVFLRAAFLAARDEQRAATPRDASARAYVESGRSAAGAAAHELRQVEAADEEVEARWRSFESEVSALDTADAADRWRRADRARRRRGEDARVRAHEENQRQLRARARAADISSCGSVAAWPRAVRG